jgi:methyl-accepting chemotaxis protein
MVIERSPTNLPEASSQSTRNPFRRAAGSARRTKNRISAIARLLDRADSALDDLEQLRACAHEIAQNLADLTESAAGIDRNAAEIAREITGLTSAAQGIDTHAERLASEAQSIAGMLPTVQRLTDIVDPLDSTVSRLGRLVDLIPGGRRTPPRRDEGP